MRKSGRSLNLIDAFSLLNSENKSIHFCCGQQLFFFSQLLIDDFGDTWENFMLMTKNFREKVVDYILPCLSTALHKVTSIKRNFHPSGLFGNWGTEARRLLRVEKEEASIFEAEDLATTTVADIFVELYYLTRPIIVFTEVLVRALVFCCIGFIQSKCSHCRPSLFTATK